MYKGITVCVMLKVHDFREYKNFEFLGDNTYSLVKDLIILDFYYPNTTEEF